MNDSFAERLNLPASKGHQLLTLIGFSFIFFEIIFVFLYSDEFWFSLDIRWLGIPAILLVVALSHFILLALQSDKTCWLVQPIWKGKPPIAYTRWITVDTDGFTYGIRHIKWAAVDEVFLTLFGNLEIRSDAFSGPVFKFPFGYSFPSEQRIFLERARLGNPALKVNRRLEKRLESPIVKGQNFIQMLGGGLMTLVLLDVGFSSMSYLELLKHYYLAQKNHSREELELADFMRSTALSWSYVTNRFLRVGTSGAGIYQARANAELALGNPEAALDDAKKAREMTPDNFRAYLLEARILSILGRGSDAKDAIGKAIEHHKDSLLPRLYLIANADDETAKRSAYVSSLKDLGESTFADEPRWPPGGNLFIHDVFYSDDVHYVFDRLLHVDSKATTPQ